MGTLIGADLTNLDKVRGLGAPVASIGGAGTFDGIFLTGILAVLLASIFHPAPAPPRSCIEPAGTKIGAARPQKCGGGAAAMIRSSGASRERVARARSAHQQRF